MPGYSKPDWAKSGQRKAFLISEPTNAMNLYGNNRVHNIKHGIDNLHERIEIRFSVSLQFIVGPCDPKRSLWEQRCYLRLRRFVIHEFPGKNKHKMRGLAWSPRKTSTQRLIIRHIIVLRWMWRMKHNIPHEIWHSVLLFSPQRENPRYGISNLTSWVLIKIQTCAVR